MTLTLAVSYEGRLVSSELPGERWLWLLWEPFTVLWTNGERSGTITVPRNFVTNFASVPRCFWSFCPPTDGHIRRAAVFHDLLYSVREYSRAFADALLFAGMESLGAPLWKRWLVWAGVRIGGRRAYRDGPATYARNAEDFNYLFHTAPLGTITVQDETLGWLYYNPPEYVTRRE